MKIAVIGAGAVGGYCAVRLMKAGHTVSVVEVGKHLDAIRKKGLRVRTFREEDLLVHPMAADNPSEIGPVDLVIVAVQSQNTSAIARGLLPLIGNRTFVLPLQNNVDNSEILAKAIGQDHVLLATIFIASSRPEPGLVRQLSERIVVYLGEFDGRTSPRTDALATAFTDAGIPATATADVWKEIWIKFGFVIGFYLTAPLLCSAGEILNLEETRVLHLHLVKEVASVAHAKGVELGEQELNGIIRDTRSYGDYLPSAVQEMEEGRSDEYVHMLKSLVRLGIESQTPTPMAEATLAFTRFYNERNKQSRTENSK